MLTYLVGVTDRSLQALHHHFYTVCWRNDHVLSEFASGKKFLVSTFERWHSPVCKVAGGFALLWIKMPIVGVNRDRLFEALGRKYSESRGRLQAQTGLSLQQPAAH
jgi:hypothetical protein